MSETRSSFDIEGESLTSGKANRFVQNKDIVNLIRMIASEGRLSNNRRKQFALKVPLDVLNSIEEIVQEVFRP